MPRPPWTNRYKNNWDDAYRRLMAWWEGDGLDRPVVLQPVLRPDFPPPDPALDLTRISESHDLDETFRLASEQNIFAGSLYPAESAPLAMTGYASALGMLGGMAGAPIHYTPDTNTAWVGEVPNLYDRDLPEFNPAFPPYAFALRMIRRHHETFGYDAVLGACPLLDPLTTLSMMRGPEQLCFDLVECPDMVRRWTRRLGDLMLQIAAGYRAARAALGRREDTSWTTLWAPGDMEALQCDFSTMLSPAMFNEFVMPELERQLEFYDYAMWHLDGTAEIRHLDSLLSLKKLRAIQWVDEQWASARRNPLVHLDLLKRIRKAGRSIQMVPSENPDIAVELTKALGKDGLCFWRLGTKTEAEMDDALRRLAAV